MVARGVLILRCRRCNTPFEHKAQRGIVPEFCSRKCRDRWIYASTHTLSRATKAEMELRLDDLYDICMQNAPLTVRNAYYLAVVAKIVAKLQSGYDKVQQAVLELRRTGRRSDGLRLPYESIVDNTRWQRKPVTHSSAEAALARTARLYRRDLWEWANVYLEVWCESDSIAGLATGICQAWDVPLMITRGFSSETFAYNAAQKFQIEVDAGRWIVVIYIGDLDPAGVHMEMRLQEIILDNVTFDPSWLNWNRLFVTKEQRDVTMVNELRDLGTTAKLSSYAKTWRALVGGGEAVEAEAIKPDTFRAELTAGIEDWVDDRQLEILRAVEVEEKAGIERLSQKMRPTKRLLELRSELDDYNRTLGWDI